MLSSLLSWRNPILQRVQKSHKESYGLTKYDAMLSTLILTKSLTNIGVPKLFIMMSSKLNSFSIWSSKGSKNKCNQKCTQTLIAL